MDSPRTDTTSSGQRQKQAQRQQGQAADPSIPRSSSGMQMSDEMPKQQQGGHADPMNFALHGGRYGDPLEGNLAGETLPLSMAHKTRKDNNNGSGSGLLRPYPIAAGLHAAGGSSIGSTPMGSEAATVSDDSQAEGDLHPFEVAPRVMDTKQKQKQKQKQKEKQPQQAPAHHVAHITAAAMPSKVFNGEAWLLDPYGTGNNPLSSSDLRNRGITTTAAAAVGKGLRSLGKGKETVAGPGASGSAMSAGNMLDQYGETDTSHAGRASLASDGDIELPAQHEVVQDRFGSPGADDLGI